MKRRALALWPLVLLGACASPPRAANEAPWTSGRLSVRIEATETRPAQSVNASFELQGGGDRGELRLNSPLGTRVASARWAPGLAVLSHGDGEQRFADLADLSRQALGENLPLAALPDWLAGRPWPAAPHVAGESGFEQLGWQVSLARRSEGWVEARRAAAPAVLLRVKLDESP